MTRIGGQACGSPNSASASLPGAAPDEVASTCVHTARLLAGTLTALAVLTQLANADPRTDYMLHCQGCHLEDGHGVRGVMPGLRGEVGRIAGVPGGRDYLMRVPGVANATLASPELAGVLNWVMDNFNGSTRPPDFQPFAPDEVAKARAQPLASPGRERTRIYHAPDY